MIEQTSEKRKPILLSMAVVLTILHVVVIVIFLPQLYSTHNFAFALPMLAVGGLAFILSLISFVEKRLRTSGIFTAVNFFFSFIQGCGILLCFVLNNLFVIPSEKSEAYVKSIANIEYVISNMPEKNLHLYTAETADSEYYYFDDDGEIAKKFTSIEFTLEAEEQTYELSDVKFYVENVDVTFAKDFDGVVVSASSNDYLNKKYTRSYSINPQDGIEMKNMIDAKVQEEKLCFEKRNKEVYDNITLEKAIASMEKDDPLFICMVYDDKYDRGYEKAYDKNDLVFAVLKSVDETNLNTKEFVSSTLSENSGFTYYYANSTSPYSIRYYHLEKTLKISVRYKDPYGKTRTVSKCFEFTTEIDEDLMSAVAIVMTEGEYVA